MKYALQNIFNNFYVNDWPQLKKNYYYLQKKGRRNPTAEFLEVHWTTFFYT